MLFFQDGVWWEVGDSEGRPESVGGAVGSGGSALGGALGECRVAEQDQRLVLDPAHQEVSGQCHQAGVRVRAGYDGKQPWRRSGAQDEPFPDAEGQAVWSWGVNGRGGKASELS